MSDSNNLPEYFEIDRQRIAQPAYEALMPCQIIMTAENGVTGPTRVEAGEIFVTEATPCHQWLPLNRAAGERLRAWLEALPQQGHNLTVEEIMEAAYIMRPREGETEIPHEQWFPAVLKLAAAKKDKKGMQAPMPRPAQVIRPGERQQVMPFASSGPSTPMEHGRAPAPQAPSAAPAPPRQAARRPGGAKPPPPAMPNAPQTDTVAQTASS